jgi:hypothetical protein
VAGVPRSVDARHLIRAIGDDGVNWLLWVLAAGALLVALSAGGLLARRLRVRHPTTA